MSLRLKTNKLLYLRTKSVVLNAIGDDIELTVLDELNCLIGLFDRVDVGSVVLLEYNSKCTRRLTLTWYAKICFACRHNACVSF